MDSLNAYPQFRQVADTLRRRIQTGEYRSGESIPTAAQLEHSFDVSNITIRKALSILSGEGLIESQRGRGTFVTDKAEDARVLVALSHNFSEWADTAGGGNLEISQKVLDIDVRPGPPAVAERLKVAPETDLWRMRRLRRIKRNPVSYHINFGTVELLGAINENMMAGNRKFVDVIRQECGLRLHKMEQTVEAIAADRDLARILEAEFGEPTFFVTNVYSDPDGEAVAVSHLYLRGRHYAYQTTMTLDDHDGAP